MRDFLCLYVNGQRHEIRGATAFMSLTDFLRQELLLTGTKVVCAEGDCGACTVLVGRPEGQGLRYETCDACIYLLYQLDGKHVVTVEGLGPSGGDLHPVQAAMVDHHASQCGYCTPGFVMALAGHFESGEANGPASLRTALTGNLCRCTGYLSILEAGASITPKQFPPLAERYTASALLADLQEAQVQPVLVEAPGGSPGMGPVGRTFFAPRTLENAIQFKARHPEAVIVAGGTELGVLRNKRGYEPSVVMSLTRVPGLSELVIEHNSVSMGANTTWAQIEKFARDAWPELYKLVVRFGSPQIRNVATLVGNVAHGSPIADALPFLLVMDAELEVVSARGAAASKSIVSTRGTRSPNSQPTRSSRASMSRCRRQTSCCASTRYRAGTTWISRPLALPSGCAKSAK